MEVSVFEIMSALLIALLKFWIEFAVIDSISILSGTLRDMLISL